MSIYPDWIGVDISTGGIVLIDSTTVELVDDKFSISLESDIDVVIENSEVTVEYGS